MKLPLETHTFMTSPFPEGCFVLTVHAAKGLRGADWHMFGKATSDPEVEISLGMETFKTRCIPKTTDPCWDPPETAKLLLHSANQCVKVEVYDADFGDSHDFL